MSSLVSTGLRFTRTSADNLGVDFQTLCLKIGRSENLPVLPTAVLNLLKMFGDENVSSRELANVIGQDAGLAAKVLRVASSPVFGTGSCETISRAIGLIGINRMKQIAVTLGYQQFSAEKSQVPDFDKMYFWEHCKATATVAKEIMARVNRSKQDNAYMAGLIHDVGFLAMEKFAPTALNQAILVSKTRNLNIIEAEEEVCGFNHNMVSDELAQRWKLAPYLQDAIAHHNCPAESTIDEEICAVIAVANTVAYEMGCPPVRGVSGNHTSVEFLPLLNLTTEDITEIVDRAKIEIEESKSQIGARRSA